MSSYQLPPSIQGDGRKFISLLKEVIEGIYDNYDGLIKQLKEIENKTDELENNIVDEYMKNIKIDEVRQDKNIKLTVTWSPDYFSKYLHAEIWYCHYEGLSHDRPEDIQWNKISIVDGAVKHVFEGVIAGHTYEFKVLGVNKHGAKSNPNKAEPVVYYVSESQFTPDNPQLFQVSWQKGVPRWTWKQETNANYSYSELREDEHVGEVRGMLDRTLDVKSDAIPIKRTGTVYLYNVGAGPVYSPPVALEYLKSVPLAPKNVTVDNTETGIVIRFAAIPEDCTGAVISINGEEIKTDLEEYKYYIPFGEFDVKVAYYDCFGYGEWCETIHHDSSRTIDKSWLDPEDVIDVVNNAESTAKINANKLHITADTLFQGGDVIFADKDGKITTTIQNGVITADKVATGAVTSDKIATNSITAENIQSGAITSDKIATGSITADKIATGAISADDITTGTLNSDRIAAGSITADKIGVGAITADKIGAEAITGDKLKVNSLSSITANLGKVTAGTIKGVDISACNISADSFIQSGYKLKNIDFLFGVIASGEKIPIPHGVSSQNCIFWFVEVGDELPENKTQTIFKVSQRTGKLTSQIPPTYSEEYKDYITFLKHKLCIGNQYFRAGIVDGYMICADIKFPILDNPKGDIKYEIHRRYGKYGIIVKRV